MLGVLVISQFKLEWSSAQSTRALRVIERVTCNKNFSRQALRALASNTTGQLNVFGHNGYAFSVDGRQVGVFKQSNEIGFGRLLQGQDGRALEAKVGLEVLRNFAHEALERQLANE